MRDDVKSKAELLQEVETLRRRVAELEQSEDVTEHKKAEEEIKRAAEEWDRTFNAIADLVFIVDKDFTITKMNKALPEALKLKPEDIIGKKCYELLHKSDKPWPGCPFEKTKKDKKPHTQEVDDPNIGIPLLITTSPIFDDNGKLVGAVHIAKDVTEHKKAEEVLEAERGRLYSLLDGLPAFVYLQAPDHSVRFANRYFREHFGEPEGKPCYEVLWGAKEPCKPCPTFRVFDTKKPQIWEWSQSPDGRIYEINDYPFADVDGSPLVLELGIDITERKRAAEALKQYQFMVESAHDAIFFKDLKNRYIISNSKTLEAFGLSRDQVIGKNDYEIMPDKAEARKNIEDDRLVFKTGKLTEITKRMTGADGKERWFQAIKVPQFDDKGNVIGLIGIARDITEHKKAAAELNEYREKMAQTEQLASLGTLSATIAHRLTSPLTAIRLSIENSLADLETTSCPDTVTEDLKDGLSGVSEVVSIVNSFRDFARKSSEKIVSQVDVKAVAERIVKLLNESARRAKVSLHLKGMDKLPSIYSNEKDLEQLFFALVENAIQAADGKKSRQLIIDGAVKDKQIELRFADDCGGIAPENLDRIFEPFFTTRPAGEGTGLGLCVVEHIVSRAGGKIRVASKAGEGSTFFVTLPINKGRRS